MSEPGNKNAARGTEWRDAIRHELAAIGRDVDGQDPAYRKGLRQCAKEFIKAAQGGEQWAIKELADRTDGKAPQAIELTGGEGGPVEVKQWTVQPIKTLADEQDTEG